MATGHLKNRHEEIRRPRATESLRIQPYGINKTELIKGTDLVKQLVADLLSL